MKAAINNHFVNKFQESVKSRASNNLILFNRNNLSHASYVKI